MSVKLHREGSECRTPIHSQPGVGIKGEINDFSLGRPGTQNTGGWAGRYSGQPPRFDPRTVQPVAYSLRRLHYPALH